MRAVAFVAALVAPLVHGSPLNERQGGPSVSIQGGTVIGSAASGIDSFLGIPFAAPPVGPLRLRSPEPLTSPLGTFQATTPPAACPQPTSPVSSLSPIGTLVGQLRQLLAPLGLGAPLSALQSLFGSGAAAAVSEDCLTLNVYRPSLATSSSKLPVLAYIYGGGFVGGSNLAVPGHFFVNYSMMLGHPYVWVAMNYRLGGFGFLAGKELADEGSTNLGLKDQRLALQWIQKNIAAFGGDPDKVTLWGHSAGSISVMDHTIINNGDNKYNGKSLFRGAMMNSGTIVPALPVDSSRAQSLFDNVVQGAGCSTAASKLDCLRSLSYDQFFSATVSAPGKLGYGPIDFAYIPRPDPRSSFFASSPDDAVAAGKYTHVPVIAGDVEDEGTAFCQSSNIQNNDGLIAVLTAHWPGAMRDDVIQLVDTYPDDPSFGSPFRTGTANNIYPEYKRLSAIFGDTLFTLLTRKYLSVVSGTVDAYSYIGTFFYNTSNLGTAHSFDLAVATLPNPGIVVPRDSVNTYYTSFVNFGDANQFQSAYPVWNKYTPALPQLLNYSLNAVEFIADTFRQGQYQAIVSRLDKLRL